MRIRQFFLNAGIVLAMLLAPLDVLFAAEKNNVQCGVYLMSLSRLEYSKSTFDVNFYVWWLSDKESYTPDKTVEITNADQYRLIWSSRDAVKDKTRTLARYSATIRKNWNLDNFPFDRQQLVVSMEDNLLDINKVDFTCLLQGTGVHPDVVVPGWAIENFRIEKTQNLYNTNFGDVATPNSTYSRISLVIDMKRLGWNIFFIYFIGFFLAAFLCTASFMIPLSFFGERNTLTIGAIFAAIGNKYYIDNTLLPSKAVSLTDVVTLATFMYILATIVFNILIQTLHLEQKSSAVKSINYTIMFAGAAVYCGIVVIFVIRALMS